MCVYKQLLPNHRCFTLIMKRNENTKEMKLNVLFPVIPGVRWLAVGQPLWKKSPPKESPSVSPW